MGLVGYLRMFCDGAVNRNTTGLAAMDMLAALAKEKDEAIKAAKDSGLSARAFGVYWNLKDDEPLRNAGISAMELARDAETEMHRLPVQIQCLVKNSPNRRSHEVQRISAIRDRFRATWRHCQCSAPRA